MINKLLKVYKPMELVILILAFVYLTFILFLFYYILLHSTFYSVLSVVLAYVGAYNLVLWLTRLEDKHSK